ncbi:MAG: ribonuclease HII [Simkaniaceae bacterium]
MDWSYFEQQAFMNGYKIVAGIDEAGRGPLAGPVVAAACILPRDLIIEGIDDSKKLTEEKRESLFSFLINHPHVIYGVGIIDNKIIDEINILKASHRAMMEAVRALRTAPDYLLVDGNQMPASDIPLQGIVQGDSKSQSIAAASIIAKVTRDRIMKDFHEKWPHYGFDTHKGYATEKHLKAIEVYGPCPIHRLSYSPFQPDLFK